MTSRVLAIVLFSSFFIYAAQGLYSFQDYCHATRVLDYYFGYRDTFCIGVKDGQINFPEGTGCLEGDPSDCDILIHLSKFLNETIVIWNMQSRKMEKSDVIFAYFSHDKTLSMSKVGEDYRLPANLVASELVKGSVSGKMVESDKNGLVTDLLGDDDCIKRKEDGDYWISSLVLNCTNNGYKLDLKNDNVYATVVVTKNGKLVKEYQLESPIKPLGRAPEPPTNETTTIEPSVTPTGPGGTGGMPSTGETSGKGDSTESSSGLSDGVIGAVTIGPVLLLAAIVAGLFFFKNKPSNIVPEPVTATDTPAAVVVEDAPWPVSDSQMADEFKQTDPNN